MRHSIDFFCFKFLMVYSAKHREYQLVAKSTVSCFLTRIIFTMSIFPLWYVPLCSGIGGTTQIWGMVKKFPALCPQLQNRVGAYVYTG